MSFQLRYSRKVANQLELLPTDWLDDVAKELRQLADSPVTLSERVASPPFPPRGQMYHFVLEDAVAESWFFTVIFRFSQDETALHVLSITWRKLED